MKNKTYSISLQKAIEFLKKKKPRQVLLQFPSGLRPEAAEIMNALKTQSENTVFAVWAGSCFGACDIPAGLESHCFDAIFHFGHSEFDL
ncbi:MAG: diphthamide synthesis protein [Candidatus Woesearchaeota archaeon]